MIVNVYLYSVVRQEFSKSVVDVVVVVFYCCCLGVVVVVVFVVFAVLWRCWTLRLRNKQLNYPNSFLRYRKRILRPQ